MNGKFKPLKNYLQTNPKLATIRAQMQQNQAFLGQVQKLLPTPLNEHCIGLVVKQNLLVLYADSSAWASRLRYFSSELISQLKKNRININKIMVKVLVDNREIKNKPRVREARLISRNNADMLKQVAEHTADQDLREALKRLSSHRKNQE